MDTKDIPVSGPSDWRREPSERRNALLGKLAEEASELAARCSRAMIQGLNEPDPDSGRSNLQHLQDEIADVCAIADLTVTFLALDEDGINDRRKRKYAYKLPWIEALPDTSPEERVGGAYEMSRSGYSDDCENLWLWRQAVQRAIDGKRGQAFLRELLSTLDAMPNKRLISDDLVDRRGEVCAIGSVGIARGIDMKKLELEDTHQIGKAFGIAPALVAEIEFMNDDDFYSCAAGRKTPEQRWQFMRDWVAKQIRAPQHSEAQKP